MPQPSRSHQPPKQCPECGSERVWYDGVRQTVDSSIQRYLCRLCGFRFSQTAEDELGWMAIKVLKVASANPRIRIPHGSSGAMNQVLDWAGEPGISESVDFPTSAESILLKNVTGLAIEGLQEILIDRVARLAFAHWLNLPVELQTLDALAELCIMLISRKTLHELSHALGKCNEATAHDAETIIPAKIGNVTYENPNLLVIDLTA